MPAKLNWTAPVIGPRRPGWERAYVATIERHMALPFAWGQSDCLVVPADLAMAMTGSDPMRGLRRYRTEAGAGRLLVTLGFEDVEAALAAVFPPIAPAAARRGDCGIVLQPGANGTMVKATVIVIGANVYGPGRDGPIQLPRHLLISAFAIGAVS